MAISFTQSKSVGAAGVASIGLAFTNPVAAGSPLLVAGVFDGGGINQADTVTDNNNAGNWNLDKTGNLATDGDTVTVFSRVAAASGATTVTAHGTSLGGLAIHEYAGLSTSTPLDQKTSNNATGTSATSGNVTTTVANELIFGFISTSSVPTITAGTSYNIRESNSGAHLASEDQIVAATNTFATTFTLSLSDEYCDVIATYSAGGAAPSLLPLGSGILT